MASNHDGWQHLAAAEYKRNSRKQIKTLIKYWNSTGIRYNYYLVFKQVEVPVQQPKFGYIKIQHSLWSRGGQSARTSVFDLNKLLTQKRLWDSEPNEPHKARAKATNTSWPLQKWKFSSLCSRKRTRMHTRTNERNSGRCNINDKTQYKNDTANLLEAFGRLTVHSNLIKQ